MREMQGKGVSAAAQGRGTAAGRPARLGRVPSPSLRFFHLYCFYPAARSFAARPGGASGTSS